MEAIYRFHPLFRDAMVRLLRSWAELEVIGEAPSGRAALERIRASIPSDVLVRGTARSYSPAVRDLLERRMGEIAKIARLRLADVAG